ncbi:UDP-N-acetylmuramoyl-tripeptide--D-alanyl-D-alanine ligase [Desulfonatronum thiosulfatophilum]|uniref:UDP-N-acetylmuramoyl-tripeptide--D-alanyl-D-alanine ligase n=1 Tax=Desulfonatronum thiosulfatophilum TaxID=617002 RepID=A0A1G6ANC5_9BACT|nr:UDP-N-acetylmuramoyl-tripeptide--D-alanyl-D-alanine ligase [Desulfonatronum thiosulfatophilum]SDB09904.1 UDP-N-acetylmuramoyl-tripeptide--D-alanyl-D-alanine ligase [Desulfonatronum thiosulfatophilum]
MRLTLRWMADVLDVPFAGEVSETVISGICIDSRRVRPGELFVCLPGTRTDGHDHAPLAVENGAAAVLATKELPGIADRVPVLVVSDGVAALGELARAWRKMFRGKVIGVTGTAGKTTVKELLSQVCSLAGPTCKNQMNWNNQIGLPMSILSCSGQAEYWVLEAGISRPGDMDELGLILQPDMALLINAGAAHLAELGCVEQVAKAKARLTNYLRPGGIALTNRDCPDLWRESLTYGRQVHGFSVQDSGADFYSGGQTCTPSGDVHMELRLQGRNMELTWTAGQAPVAENVLAVAAAATLLGIDSESIQHGLTTPMNLQGRFAVQRHGNWTIIDDTYNANPLSMALALDRARRLAGEGHLVCVLGDMLELGEVASDEHRKLGRLLAEKGCSVVFYHGRHFPDVSSGLEECSWQGRLVPADSPAEFLDQWRQWVTLICGAGVVLFKGSRASGMETYYDVLRTELDA